MSPNSNYPFEFNLLELNYLVWLYLIRSVLLTCFPYYLPSYSVNYEFRFALVEKNNFMLWFDVQMEKENGDFGFLDKSFFLLAPREHHCNCLGPSVLHHWS
ncbi:hypothetical protein Ancab_032999 [Ancistrocladus abbreviatus]